MRTPKAPNRIGFGACRGLAGGGVLKRYLGRDGPMIGGPGRYHNVGLRAFLAHYSGIFNNQAVPPSENEIDAVVVVFRIGRVAGGGPGEGGYFTFLKALLNHQSQHVWRLTPVHLTERKTGHLPGLAFP